MNKGKFITFEGGDGCGKSTHAHKLKEYLDQKRVPSVLTEEPGGTHLGEEIKALLLDHKHGKMTPTAELLLFAAARAEHVESLIKHAIEAGKWVISSRFSDATWVYQGIARGLDLELIEQLAEVATAGLKPDLTVLLDVDPKKGLDRAKSADKATAPKGVSDKIESEGIAFQEKVRQGYLDLARREPDRFFVLSTEEPAEKVQQKIRDRIDQLIETGK